MNSRYFYSYLLFNLIFVFLFSCSENTYKNPKSLKLDTAYKIKLQENDQIVYTSPPKQVLDKGIDVCLLNADGKSISIVNKLTGELKKSLHIEELDINKALSFLIENEGLDLNVEEILENPHAMNATRFYSLVNSGQSIHIVLTTMLPSIKSMKYKGKSVTAKSWEYRNMIIGLNEDLKIGKFFSLDRNTLNSKQLSPANSSVWVMSGDFLLTPLQYQTKESNKYNFAIFLKSEDTFQLLKIDSSLKFNSGLHKLGSHPFFQFNWTYSDSILTIGKDLYTLNNSTEHGLRIMEYEDISFNEPVGGVKFINNKVYFEVFPNASRDTNSVIEIKVSESKNPDVSSSSIFLNGFKKFRSTRPLFCDQGIFYVMKKSDKNPCELVFTPY